MNTNLVPITKVVADADQPRKFFDQAKLATLTKSIKAHGILTPLTVEKQGEEFLLVDGERRFRAAKLAGLKEVPVNVIPNKDKLVRAVEQFHLQEMHEGWSPSEKAEVIANLCVEMKKSFAEVCSILNINPNNARKLWALSKISERDLYNRENIAIEYAEPITYLTKFVKTLKENDDEAFTLGEKKRLERAVIKNIADGTFTSSRDVTRLKDTFKSNPKTIEKFMAGGDANELFVESKARAAYHLRNAISSAGYTGTHINAFLKDPRVKVDNPAPFVSALKAIRALLAKAGIEEE